MQPYKRCIILYISYFKNMGLDVQIKKTVNLPKELLKEATDLSGASTQTMAIVLALEEYVKRKKLEKLLQLKGSGRVKFPKNYRER